jgi:CDP-diacylglycerol--glycerol-3-phosphate 3-phosphatidyltransferase
VAAKLRDSFEARELTYPSNLLTIARLLLLPLTIFYLRRPEQRRKALLCMGLAMLTDALDGPIARRRGEVSRLGKLLDPIADKLVLNTTAVTLSQTRGFPWWITTLLLVRDAVILLAGLLVYRRTSHITAAQSTGKATTVALTAAVLLYTADGPRSGKPALYVALVPFALSLWQYGRRFVMIMRQNNQADSP